MTSLPGLKTERGLQSKTKNFAEVKFAHWSRSRSHDDDISLCFNLNFWELLQVLQENSSVLTGWVHSEKSNSPGEGAQGAI